MLKDSLTYLIFSCDKFSDLWDGNIIQLRKYWPDRDFKTFIITDRATDKSFDDVEIISAEGSLEWSERLKYALNYVSTDFVFITLDDYFLVSPVKNAEIQSLIDLMRSGNYDYIRLFPNPKRATGMPIEGYNGLYNVKVNCNYSVNLYAGIWRKEFLEYTVQQPVNVWRFEVTLCEKAQKYGARCLVSYNKEYVILDVVRKGKILHSAAKYFKTHPGIYTGNREVQSLWYEFRLWIKTMIARYSPGFMVKPLRKIYVLFGGKSFVQEK